MAMTAFPAGAGGYAEFAVVDAGLVAPVPPECSLVEAAGVPLAASTAFEVLDRLGLAAESSVLVLGAERRRRNVPRATRRRSRPPDRRGRQRALPQLAAR
jgi:hypothetical protein